MHDGESATREIHETLPFDARWEDLPDGGAQLRLTGLAAETGDYLRVVVDQLMEAAVDGVVSQVDATAVIRRWFEQASCPSWCLRDHGRPDPQGFHHDGASEGLEPRWQLEGDDNLFVMPSEFTPALDVVCPVPSLPAGVALQDSRRTLALLMPQEARQLADMLLRSAGLAEQRNVGRWAEGDAATWVERITAGLSPQERAMLAEDLFTERQIRGGHPSSPQGEPDEPAG